ncbi:hypothetical protein A2U01_0031623, partial [Trifolium medium]|nr:hypothetical protein [Trifolium medium]
YEGSDVLAYPERALGATYFKRAVKEWERAVAVAAGPPPTQHQQHQAPPYIPQQQQFTDYELGMAASTYVQHVRMDWGLPHFSPQLIAASTRLLEHQNHVQDTWSEYWQRHPPAPHHDADDLERELEEALDQIPEESPTRFFSAGGSSSHPGQ